MITSAHAQWTVPEQIVYGHLLYGPRAVSVGDTIHVDAWGTYSFYYLRSNDNGETWSQPICPVDSFYRTRTSDITFSNSILYSAFYGRETVNDPLKCYLIKSSDGGRNWSEPIEVFHLAWKYPRLAAKGDTLFYSICLPQLILMRSYDAGENWEGYYIIEADSGMFIDHAPYLLYHNGRLHAIYQCGLVFDSVGIEIYYRYSDDQGQNWSDRIPLSTPEPIPYHKHSQFQSATIDSAGNILVLWFDYKYGSACGVTGDILGRISRDNGNTWLPETRITYTQTGRKSTSVILNDTLYAIWEDDYPFGCFYPKLMYSKSSNWGDSWSIPEVIDDLSNPTENEPFLLTTGEGSTLKFHCIFRGNTFPGYDLFYTSSDNFTEVAKGDLPEIPNCIRIRAYPNPFNSQTIITLSDVEGGGNNIKIYDINGRLVRILDLNGVKGGDKSAIWDATDALGNRVSSGIYFARARGSGSKATIKLLYLK